MRYTEIAPTPQLVRFVECMWYLECDQAGTVQRVVPDGAMELVLHAGDPFAEVRDGVTQTQAQVVLSGQLTRPIFLSQNSRGRVFGIRFRPTGAAALLRSDADEFTDSLLPLEQVSSSLHRDLRDSLSEKQPDRVFARIATVLQERAKFARPSSRMEYATSRICSTDGNAPIEKIAQEMGITMRQLQRLFRTHVGISAKTLCRLARFQAVLARLQADWNGWADAALQVGYFDQSHLLRDFRQFAGVTPTFLLSPSTDLAEHFTRRQRSHFSKTTVGA